MFTYHEDFLSCHCVFICVAIYFSVDSCAVPGVVHRQTARHASLKSIVAVHVVVRAQDVHHLLDLVEASIDDKVQVWIELFQFEDPVIFQRWYCSILFGVKSFQECLPRMDDELSDTTLLTHNSDKLNDVFPFVVVINAQPTLDCHWYGHIGPHLSHDFRHQLRVMHQNSPKTTLHSLVRWAATVDIHFIVAKVLDHFGSLSHLSRVIASQLAHNRVLIVAEREEPLTSLTSMEDSMLIQHLCV